MKATLICTDMCNSMMTFNDGQPDCLLPLVDRPFVQQVVERIVGAGVEQLHFVVGSESSALRRLLGDGSRWGVNFTFHEAEDGNRPFDALREGFDWGDSSQMLLASATRLPQIDVAAAFGQPQFQCWVDGRGNWTGWATLNQEMLEASPEFSTADAFGEFLQAAGSQASEVDSGLGAGSFEQLLDSQRRVLEGEFPGLFVNGREPKLPGVRFCRNAKMHASSEARPPVFLGDNVRVGKGVVLGPNTVIGDNCIIDRNVMIQNSLILPGTYVGEWLEINDCVVGQTSFVNARLGATVPVDDSLILCSA